MAAEEDPEVSFGQLKKFSLPELRIATDNFSNNNILGKGGYGKVYIGRLTNGGNVAVKRLNPERIRGEDKQFKREVEMISMAVHRNLLRLIGFCMTSSERLLVYPLMANGSLESCLRGTLVSLLYRGGLMYVICIAFISNLPQCVSQVKNLFSYMSFSGSNESLTFHVKCLSPMLIYFL